MNVVLCSVLIRVLYQFGLNNVTILLNFISLVTYKDILTFWLDRDIDGFNIRDPGFIFEDFDLRNNTVKPGITSPGVRA
ncbi:hypothetical protein DPMN_080128 [Dreissena polymorpha]|uniref:Uncharacterized protein n=1 Tax=Dreissena polymorpha TaxID=45954 RepID=A0A9D4BQP9_DREPO|nr:hypothetical protein DPMN_080128 [Dreissena polymorpha]